MSIIKAELVRSGDFIKLREKEGFAEVVCVEKRENGMMLRFHLKRVSLAENCYVDVPCNNEVIKR